MHYLFMGLIYPDEDYAMLAQKSKHGMQTQIDHFQKLVISALEQNPKVESVQVCNVWPVGIFPRHFANLYLPRKYNGNVHSLPAINLPYFKQKMREKEAFVFLQKWVTKNPKNRNILIYSLYLPYMRAAVAIKKQFPDVKLGIIVPDIPGALGLASGRTGLLQKIEQKRVNASLALCKHFDRFVLLTEAMKHALPLSNNANYIVMEAIAPKMVETANEDDIVKTYQKYHLPIDKPCVVYTGTLQEELGILDCIQSFADSRLQNVHLVLAGAGKDAAKVQVLCEDKSNCHYIGFIPRDDALHIQQGASVLINPRKNGHAYTAYSFPSKTMEYMLSGKPVLCYQLDGIPEEYNSYLHYIGKDLVSSICNVLEQEPFALQMKGEAAKQFVLQNKNADAQTERIVQMFE